MNSEKIKIAAEMFSILLRKRQLTEVNDSLLYGYYLNDMEIRLALESMLDGLGFYLFNSGDAIYLSVKKDNITFGYTNQKLRSVLKITDNKELYICYFIMYVLMLTCYKDSSANTLKLYIINTDLLKAVNDKLKSMAEDKEYDEKKEEGFAYMYTVWNVLPDISIKSKEEDIHEQNNTSTKIGFINKVLNFFNDEGLLRKNVEERTYSPTSRFRVIVENYFSDRENKAELNSLINE
ncbi:DUF6063 family protein [Sedimentibacter sp. B4]|uniref:DUF6063 family protein n=1 Tax=Sedimentibacter sp. B4 TaxID=304766 RepID=UPI0002FF03EF|nr:DUF6063 family protein [Sedimentibacter sp. B4]